MRATLRNRFHTSGVQITLTSPVSSSRLRNTTPFAVSGCWRCVTTPATSTTVRSGSSRSVSAVTTPRAVSSSRTNSVGWRAGRQPGRPEVGRDLLDLVHPRQRGRVDARDHARAACRARASRNAPAAHSAAAPGRGRSTRTRPRSRAPRARRWARSVRRVKSSRSVNGCARALVVDAVEQRVAQAAHVPQPDAHRVDRRVGVPTRPRAYRSGPRPRCAARACSRVATAATHGPEHLDAVTDARRARCVCGE